MSEHELIQQERELLRDLRNVVAERIQAEAEAYARLEQKWDATKVEIDKVQYYAPLIDMRRKINDVLEPLRANRGSLPNWLSTLEVSVLDEFIEGVEIVPKIDHFIHEANKDLSELNKEIQFHASIQGKGFQERMYIVFDEWTMNFIIASIFITWFITMIATHSFLAGWSVPAILFLVSLFYFLLVPGRTKKQISEHYILVEEAMANAEYWHREWLKSHAMEELVRSLDVATESYQKELASIKDNFEKEVARIQQELADLNARVDSTSPPLTNEAWNGWAPPGDLVPILKLGSWYMQIEEHQFRFPHLFSFPNGHPIMFKVNSSTK